MVRRAGESWQAIFHAFCKVARSSFKEVRFRFPAEGGNIRSNILNASGGCLLDLSLMQTNADQLPINWLK